jgi:hypothetical protein
MAGAERPRGAAGGTPTALVAADGAFTDGE